MGKSEQEDPRWLLPVALVLALVAMAVSLSIPMFIGPSEAAVFEEARAKVGGDPDNGLTAMKRYGCAACHIIPGLKGAKGHVGPSLAGFANRTHIGNSGKLPNTPDNLVNWIMHPVVMDHTATMPNVGASEQAARDMATYLYALK